MKICKIFIKKYQQFKNFDLDFTCPDTGLPLEKICFIGKNGTGKTTLLNLLKEALLGLEKGHLGQIDFLKIYIEGHFYYILQQEKLQIFKTDKEDSFWHFFIKNEKTGSKKFFQEIDNHKLSKNETQSLLNRIIFKNNSNQVVIHAPAESNQAYQKIEDVPSTNLNQALNLFQDFPFYHTIAAEHVHDFWKLLIFLIKKRENDFREFEKREENLDKTVRQVNREFDKTNPVILEKVGQIWNKILRSAGLEFDTEDASNPIQLNDNLKAYIRLISSKEKIEYHQLSTGIRNFIFKLGHLYALYFNRKIEAGFLLVDEPESSLFPDFLYDLIDTYFNITQNTQFFVATHHPIIAAQFQAYERFILTFNEDKFVEARKGLTPVGDDPNDILIQDFSIRNILGKEGIKSWERFIKLKTLIPLQQDKKVKKTMIEEFMKIGNAYNFAINEIS